MVFNCLEENDIQNRSMIIFCLTFCFEMIFFSLAVYFNSENIPISIFVQFSCCLTFGNIFLLYGIFTKKTTNFAMYFIVYTYTIILNFLDSSNHHGLYLTFKLCQVISTLLRGVTVIIYYRKFANKFISFYFKKYQSDLTLIGKY